MISGILDLRSQSQQDAYWRITWRLRCAANPRIKAANMALAEWHKRNDAPVIQPKRSNVISMFLRRQAE
ncbi:MAG: hypothetical protein ABL964_09845 [Steroidobacteraceae bacterium]